MITNPVFARATILLPFFIFAYFDTLTLVVRGWFTRSLSYGFIIFCISIFMVWSKRDVLRMTPIRESFLGGVLLTITGCLMLAAGTVSNTLYLQILSIIVTIFGLVWLNYGNSFLKTLFFPIIYLIFMFPLIAELLSSFSIYLQLLSAKLATAMLSLTGMSLFRDGQIIILPHITLDVAKVCSGVNHVITLAAFSIPLAYYTQTGVVRKVVLISSAAVAGIFANSLRIALIGVWTYFNRDASIHGPYNTFITTTFILGVGSLILVLLSMLLSRGSTKGREKETGIMAGNEVENRLKMGKASVSGILILLTTALFLHFFKPAPAQLKYDLREIPIEVGEWKGMETVELGEPFESAKPDRELKRIYTDSRGNQIKLSIGYFSSQRKEREVFNYQYNMLHENSSDLLLDMGFSDGVIIKQTRYGIEERRKDAYFWYVIGGQVFSDRYRAKLRIMLDGLTRGRTSAAIVIISHGSDGFRDDRERVDSHLKFIKEIIPHIQSHLI